LRQQHPAALPEEICYPTECGFDGFDGFNGFNGFMSRAQYDSHIDLISYP